MSIGPYADGVGPEWGDQPRTPRAHRPISATPQEAFRRIATQYRSAAADAFAGGDDTRALALRDFAQQVDDLAAKAPVITPRPTKVTRS